jgi:hypothetical protein
MIIVNKKEVITMKKYTQAELRRLVAGGYAIDITNTHDYKAIPEPYTQIGYAHGIYGCIGKLFKGESGKLYAVTKPTSAMFMF